METEAEASEEKLTGGDKEAFERHMAQVQERIQAAQAKGDMAEVMRLADSLSKSVSSKTAAAGQAGIELQTATTKCGTQPAEPQPPASPSETQPNLDADGAKASGLTQEQYALMKERAQMRLMRTARYEIVPRCGPSDAELGVLKKRRPELCKARKPLRQAGH